MITQMFYIVLALLFAIHHLGLPKIFVVIGCLGWGEFLMKMMASHFPKRQLKPESESKSVDGEEVGIKVEKPNEIPAVIEQVETLQNKPESLNFQTREAILAIESLSDEIPAHNQELDETPEEPVSEPKYIPDEVRPSNQQLETDEKKPELVSLTETIVDTENVTVTNKDQQVLGETELTEITEETIIPEEKREQVEEQPSKNQFNKSTDNQLRHKPQDPQVQPLIPEKPELLNDQTMDEKPEEPSPEIVSKPKDTLAEVPASNEQFETDEKRPDPKSLTENWQKTIDDTGNVTIEDPVLGETKLLEIAKETIIPEESEQVKEQPSKSESKTTDNQFRLKPGDPHALPPNPEKSQLEQNRAMDEKPEATEPLPDCEEDNQRALEPKETIPAESNKECPPPEAEEVDKAPRHVEIIIRRPVNFPEADKFYISMRVEEWRNEICNQVKKAKSKKFLGSALEVNQKFTIDTRNPEKCFLTLKVKKTSKLGLETSTVGQIKMTVSDLMDIISRKHSHLIWLPLSDESGNPVGEALLEMDIKIDGLPDDTPNPAEVKRQRNIKKAKRINRRRI
jgi:hypothetical protein